MQSMRRFEAALSMFCNPTRNSVVKCWKLVVKLTEIKDFCFGKQSLLVHL